MALLVLMAVAATAAYTAFALADGVHNDVSNSQQSSNNQAQTGTEFPVRFWISATGGDAGDAGGANCNAANGTPAKISLIAPAGSGLTFRPATLEIDECSNDPADTEFIINICGTKAGVFSRNDDTNITADVVDDDGTVYAVLNADVELTVTGDDAEDCDGVTTVVNNDPTVKTPAAGDLDQPEGSALYAEGEFEDPDGDALTLSANGAPGTFTRDPNSNGNDNQWRWEHTPYDNTSGSVTITAEDGKGGTAATDSFNWQSSNVDPDIQNIAVTGSACRPSVTFGIVDPGTDDTWASGVNFDGLFALSTLAEQDVDASIYSATAPGALTKAGVYPSTGTKTIGIGVKDDDGGSDTDSVAHTVPNTVAEARFGPPVQIDGNGRGLFKAGSTIPVKVRAGACAFESNGSYTPVSGANLKVLSLAYVGPDATGTPVTATSNVKANTDGWMRPSSDQYIYNLQLPKTARGTYTLAVEGWDATKQSATGIVAQKDIAIR